MARIGPAIVATLLSALVWVFTQVIVHEQARAHDMEGICGSLTTAVMVAESAPGAFSELERPLSNARTTAYLLPGGDARQVPSWALGRDVLALLPGGSTRTQPLYGTTRWDRPVQETGNSWVAEFPHALTTPSTDSWATQRLASGDVVLVTRYEGSHGYVADWRLSLGLAGVGGLLVGLAWSRKPTAVALGLAVLCLEFAVQWTALPDAAVKELGDEVRAKHLAQMRELSGDPERWAVRRCGKR
ncbi:MAG: hypothetical protein ACRBN8_11020 [Nannocystales bacterium]